MTSVKEHWNSVYSSLASLPWDTERLPAEILSCLPHLRAGSRILDVGCGRGQHALRLAGFGYSVLGIDISDIAINQAITAADRAKLFVLFHCLDALEFRADRPFDLVIDYSVFHHIPIVQRSRYAERVDEWTGNGGQFLLVCYSDRDPASGGQEIREGAFGNTIAHPSVEAVNAVFGNKLRLLRYSETVLGEKVPHIAHHFFFENTRPIA